MPSQSTQLNHHLPSGLFLRQTSLPLASPLSLWLLDERVAERPLPPETARVLAEGPPFWSICWAAGMVLANYFLSRPELVRGATVIDFGAGSGVISVAAALAGARVVYAVDCDPVALEACRENAALNGVSIQTCLSLAEAPARADWVTAGDLFYDPANLPLIERLRAVGEHFLVGEARCPNLDRHVLRKVDTVRSTTIPAFHDPQFETVTLWISEHR